MSNGMFLIGKIKSDSMKDGRYVATIASCTDRTCTRVIEENENPDAGGADQEQHGDKNEFDETSPERHIEDEIPDRKGAYDIEQADQDIGNRACPAPPRNRAPAL